MSVDANAGFSPAPVSPVQAAVMQQFIQSMDLKGVTYMLRRRQKLIAGIAALCMFLGLGIAMAMTPIYQSHVLVMIEPRHTDVVNIGAVLSPLAANLEIVHSEMDIIRSRDVIDRVIDRLDLTHDPEFTAPAHFWQTLGGGTWGDGAISATDKKTRIRALIAEAIAKKLTVTNDGKSYVMDISFQSKDPRKAARIANAFADAYLAGQMESKYRTVARANTWLNDRLGELKGKAEASESALEEYREKSRLIPLTDGETATTRQLNDISAQLSEARGDVSMAEARLHAAEMMRHSPQGVDSASDVLASPLIQNLHEQEAELRRSQAELATRYGPLHPKMIDAQAQSRELQDKIAEETRKIVQSLASQVAVARSKEKRLESQLEIFEHRAGIEMKKSVGLHQLQREADANRGIYENFLTRFKQTSEQSDMQIADARVIAPAEAPLTPSFPNKLLFMLVGALVGAMVGIAFAYLIEYFDKGFRNAAQIEESFGMPVIGIVPDIRKMTARQPEDYVADKPMSVYGEALRTVRTAIHFSNVDRPPKVVMVTSSVPGEGKTTFCLSLARTLARTGNRVLLIDADMRRSRVAVAAGLRNFSGGLAAILSNERSFDETVVTDPVIGNLDIVFATEKTPNAQDLLASLAMQKLVQDVAKLYDLVIIDTPPILAVADAAMVSRLSDATLFLVRWATTPREQALAALKQLSHLKCRVAGLVLSQVDLARHATYTDSHYHPDYIDYYAN